MTAVKKVKPSKETKEVLAITKQPHPQSMQQIAYTPDVLLSMAIQGTMDTDKLQKLLDLHDRWLARKALEAFNEAFSLFQSLAPDLRKNKQVSFDHKDGKGSTNYKYQELGDISAHIREPLATCGLSYNWIQKDGPDGTISVTCILKHRGGHQEVGEPLTGKPDDSGKKNNIQQKASTITYLKRYTLIGILGLSSTDPDDDGRASGSYSDAQVVDDNGLPRMTGEEFDKAETKVREGKWDLDFIKKAWNLTSGQEQAFNTILTNKSNG